jgi:hypothetical protein
LIIVYRSIKNKVPKNRLPRQRTAKHPVAMTQEIASPFKGKKHYAITGGAFSGLKLSEIKI